jgi:hypothetical protein
MDDVKKAREALITEMTAALEKVEPVDLPDAVISLMLVPLFIGGTSKMLFNAIKLMLACMFNAAFKLVQAPFLAVWLWVDACILLLWFLKETAKRMSCGWK